MIQNLITAVLVSMAVGGNTATAFIKEPKPANSEITQSITTNVINKTETDLNNKKWFKEIEYTNIEDPDDPIEVDSYIYYNQSSFSNDLYNVNYRYYYQIYKNTKPGTETSIIGNNLYVVSLIKITTYVDLQTYRIYNPINARTFVEDENGQDIYVSYAEQSVYYHVYQCDNENTILDQYIMGNTPPTEMYNTNKTLEWYALNVLNRQCTLKNWNSIEDSLDHQDGVIGSELEWDYTIANTTASTFYIMCTWDLETGAMDTEQQNDPDYINLKTNFTRYDLTLDINYNTTLVLNSDGTTTPVITQEIVPIIDIMYTVLTMPFTFISQAFNLTLFAGTAYAINFADIFKILLTILIIMFIVHTIMRFTK